MPGISEQQLFDEILENRNQLSDVREILNNGVTKQVKQNTTALNHLSETIDNLQTEINRSLNLREGRMSTWKLIGSNLISIIVVTCTMVTVLWQLGLLA